MLCMILKNYRKPFFHAVISWCGWKYLLCKLESWSRSAEEEKHVRLGSREKGWDTL